MTRLRPLLLSLALLLSGCAAPAPPRSSLRAVCLSKNISYGAQRWSDEFEHAYGRKPVTFICHGGCRRGEWVCFPDDGPEMPVEGVVRLLKKLYPGQPLLLVVCNAGGFDVPLRGVYYAHGYVWSIPGPDRRPCIQDGLEWEDAVGDINEFREGKETK